MEVQRPWPDRQFFVDMHNAPIVWCVFRGPPTDAEIEEFIQDFDTIFKAGKPYCVLGIADRLTIMTLKQRQTFTAWIKETMEHTKRYCAGAAYIAGGPVSAGLVKALFWVSPLPVPMHAATSVAEAVDWAVKTLGERNITETTPRATLLARAALLDKIHRQS